MSSVVARLESVPTVSPAAMAFTVTPQRARLLRQGPGEAHQRAFGRGVIVIRHDGGVDEVAGYVDDASTGLTSHLRQHGLAGVVRAF